VNLLEAMEAELRARASWNEHAAVYYVLGGGEAVELRDFGLPDILWSAAGDPVLLLESLVSFTSAYRRGHPGEPQPVVPESTSGVAFRTEAWMLASDAELPQDEVMAVGGHGLIHAHPQRVEIRNMIAVLRDGTFHTALQRRDTGEVQSGLAAGEGRVPQVLAELMLEMSDMRKRPF
jgi:hypothetical protein